MRMSLIAIGTLAAGCTLNSSHSGNDTGPVGHTFTADRMIDGPSSCVPFDQENAPHQIAVEANAVIVDGVPATAVSVQDVAANQSSTPPNLMFSSDESWISAEGAARPRIDFTLWADGNSATGHAQTSFTFDSIETGLTPCSYLWTVNGF
jgi:hypothetical protein